MKSILLLILGTVFISQGLWAQSLNPSSFGDGSTSELCRLEVEQGLGVISLKRIDIDFKVIELIGEGIYNNCKLGLSGGKPLVCVDKISSLRDASYLDINTYYIDEKLKLWYKGIESYAQEVQVNYVKVSSRSSRIRSFKLNDYNEILINKSEKKYFVDGVRVSNSVGYNREFTDIRCYKLNALTESFGGYF